MPKLGKVDFTGVSDGGFKPIPAGTWDGQTSGWEAKEANDGQSMNVLGKFKFEFDDPETGETRTQQHTQYYNLKPTALWRVKRDLIAIGADPADLEGEDVDLEALFNELFGPRPVAVVGTFINDTWKRKNKQTGEDEEVPTTSMDKVEAA